MKASAQVLLHVRVLRRVDEHDAVLVEELLVALDEDREVAAVLEREPGAAVGEDVRVHATTAVLSAGPMPDPVSRYQGPFCAGISTPADFQ